MLNAKPGSYIMLGAGRGKDDPLVHHPRYDFNDAILPVGASYWATLAEQLLPRWGVTLPIPHRRPYQAAMRRTSSASPWRAHQQRRYPGHRRQAEQRRSSPRRASLPRPGSPDRMLAAATLEPRRGPCRSGRVERRQRHRQQAERGEVEPRRSEGEAGRGQRRTSTAEAQIRSAPSGPPTKPSPSPSASPPRTAPSPRRPRPDRCGAHPRGTVAQPLGESRPRPRDRRRRRRSAARHGIAQHSRVPVGAGPPRAPSAPSAPGSARRPGRATPA